MSLSRSRLRTCHGAVLAVALVAAIVAIATGSTALAHSSAPGTSPAAVAGSGPSAEALTQSLLDLGRQYRGARPADQPAALGQLMAAAAARQQFLAALVEQDPAAVLRVAIPAGIRAGLPAQVQPYLEEEQAIEGSIEVLHEDLGSSGRYLYFLHTASQRLSLHFAADPPDIQTGARVRVKGVRVDSALALASGQSVQTLATALPNTFGGQSTLVILVNFSDKATQPYTPDYARGVIFTTTSNFFTENSFGQTWLTGTVAGWYTIALSSTVCDYSTLASQARSAATAAGNNLSAYSRLVYAFPNNACSWWGLGSVGGNPSQAWINGSLQLRVAGHELGHNLGLYHSHALECGAAVLGNGCSNIEYGDTLDIMGSSSGHFSAYQKERLGWLNYGSQPPITTVQGDGTYPLGVYEPAGADPKALKILQYTNPANGRKTWFYVEARQAVGFDAFLSSNVNVLNGVVLHLGTDSTPDSGYLLDLTPATSSWSDPGLVVGLTFADPDSGVTITPASVGPSGASVNVTFGPVPCLRGAPTVSLSPSQSQWVAPGTRVVYTVTVANTDNAGCAATRFDLSAGVPGGFTAAFVSSALTLSPGASGSTTLEVTSPQTGAADGFYTFPVTATNSVEPAYAGSASATYVIVSSLGVSVSTDRASYRRNQTVTMTATVSSLGSPVAGASVAFTLTRPNGSKATGTATTDSSGRAVWTYRIKKQDPLGTYGVSAQASLSGSVLGAGSTTFPVQ